jgi:hypothetical protein
MSKRLLVVIIGLALALTTWPALAADPGGVKVAAPRAGDQVCQGPKVLCKLMCRTLVLRKRCRPGTPCYFKSHVFCKCYYQRGTCYLRCKSRLVRRTCNRAGVCRAPVRVCRCGVPMVPPRPR